MARPRFRLTCAGCGQLIGEGQDVCIVDEEWCRRHGEPMDGRIVCRRCVEKNREIRCTEADGSIVRHHRPVAVPLGVWADIGLEQSLARRDDGWLADHVIYRVPQSVAAILDPFSGLLQGARDYLEVAARDTGLDPAKRCGIQDAIRFSPS